ncbi:MAG: hypothetical protein IT376_10750 [Polyangiaceae bacterium]|nr:hypothetical protein [Polyangiaceae bacterium]
MTARDPKVKGLAFRSVLRAVVALRGEAAAEAARRAMPPEVAEALQRGTIVATGWYPIAWYREMFSGVVRATSAELPRQIGAEAISADLAGVHKALLRLLSPQTVYSLSNRLFGNYYDTGRVTTLENRPGFVHGRASGCVGWDRNMWQELVGATERILETAGARHVRIRVLAGGGDADEACEIEARWS